MWFVRLLSKPGVSCERLVLHCQAVEKYPAWLRDKIVKAGLRRAGFEEAERHLAELRGLVGG